MDSSLLFLALIGLWLCYLVPSWLTRRHNASRTRLDDRFSGAMRTLDLRPPAVSSQSRGTLLREGAVDGSTIPSASLQQQPMEYLQTYRPAPRPGPRARVVAWLLALSVLATPVVVLLAALGRAGWPIALAAPAVAAACLGLLRWRVRVRHRGSRRASIQENPWNDAVLLTPKLAEQPAVPTTAITMLHDEDAIRTVERAAAVAAARAEADAKAAARAELLANLKPGEWLPGEVPLPAYLLKPNAPRRPFPQPEAHAQAEPQTDTVDVRTAHIVDVRDQQIDLRDQLSWWDEHAPLRRASGD